MQMKYNVIIPEWMQFQQIWTEFYMQNMISSLHCCQIHWKRQFLEWMEEWNDEISCAKNTHRTCEIQTRLHEHILLRWIILFIKIWKHFLQRCIFNIAEMAFVIWAAEKCKPSVYKHARYDKVIQTILTTLLNDFTFKCYLFSCLEKSVNNSYGFCF